MELAELLDRLQQEENLPTAFKTWPLRPDDVAAALTAFANTDGGAIILGVDNSGQVLGLDATAVDRVAQFIGNVAFNNCAPPVTVVQETLRAQGRVVLVVQIPKGDQRPYRTQRGVYYIRTTSGRRQASREELLRLFQATESLYYDETPLLRSPSDRSRRAGIGRPAGDDQRVWVRYGRYPSRTVVTELAPGAGGQGRRAPDGGGVSLAGPRAAAPTAACLSLCAAYPWHGDRRRATRSKAY